MRNSIKRIGQIYLSDVRKIARNWVAIVIIAGLAVLPSLYAWINIYASWDPYGSTGGVKVAVVNLDEGSSIAGNVLNIGAEVSESLKQNDKLGWTFFSDMEQGIHAVDSGQAYAAIIIPTDFSQKMSTILDENPKKPTLEYYVNEKINAIAPKMTDSGASTIQKQITSSFAGTVTEKVFEVLNQLGITLNEEYPKIEKYKNLLYILNDTVPDIDGRLDHLLASAKDGMVKLDASDGNVVYIKDTLNDLVDFSDHFSKDLNLTGDKLEEISPEVKEDLLLMQALSKDISAMLDDVQKGIADNKPGNLETLSNAVGDLDQMEKDLLYAADRIGEISADAKKELLDENTRLKDILVDIRKTLNSAQGSVTDLRMLSSTLFQLESLNRQLSSTLDKISDTVDSAFGALDDGIKAVEDALKKIETLIGEPSTENQQQALKSIQNAVAVIGQNSQFTTVSHLLRDIEGKLADGSQDVKQLEDSSLKLSTQLELLRNKLSSLRGDIAGRLLDMEHLTNKLATVCSNMGSFVISLRKNLNTSIEKAFEDTERMTDELIRIQDKINGVDVAGLPEKLRAVEPRLEDMKGKLNELKSRVDDDAQLMLTLEDVRKVFISLDTALERIIVNTDETLIPKLVDYMRSTSLFVSDVNGLLGGSRDDIETARTFLKDMNAKGEVTVDQIMALKKSLPNLSGLLHSVTEKVHSLDNEFDLKGISSLLQKDGAEEGDFFASPVLLNTHKLYPMENYGAGLTPFYTTLCLWVGALLLSALLTTKAKNVGFAPTITEEFLGKYLVFGSVAIAQGFIASLGDMLVLGVKPVHPVLLVVLAIYYSLIFSMIVYTLASLFGNVGKAIAVVFLVLQLAGAGGTFPIQVTPQFFQTIHKFLPFTYAIGGMREAIAGIYYPALIMDIFLLLLYFVFFLALGLCLKKWVSPALSRFTKKLGESGVMEH